MSLGQGVGMDRDKEVCLGLVGNVGTGVQGYEDIGLAGVDDLDVRTVLLHQTSEGQRHIQVDGFLPGDGTHSTGVVAAMACVDDQGKLLRLRSASHCRHEAYQ